MRGACPAIESFAAYSTSEAHSGQCRQSSFFCWDEWCDERSGAHPLVATGVTVLERIARSWIDLTTTRADSSAPAIHPLMLVV